jgi:hypothetical protein
MYGIYDYLQAWLNQCCTWMFIAWFCTMIVFFFLCDLKFKMVTTTGCMIYWQHLCFLTPESTCLQSHYLLLVHKNRFFILNEATIDGLYRQVWLYIYIYCCIFQGFYIYKYIYIVSYISGYLYTMLYISGYLYIVLYISRYILLYISGYLYTIFTVV